MATDPAWGPAPAPAPGQGWAPGGSPPSIDLSIVEALTERELEVIAALADGLTNKQIATQLRLGENTVKWHIGNMLDKTGSRDRTQLVIWAYQRGLNPTPRSGPRARTDPRKA